MTSDPLMQNQLQEIRLRNRLFCWRCCRELWQRCCELRFVVLSNARPQQHNRRQAEINGGSQEETGRGPTASTPAWRAQLWRQRHFSPLTLIPQSPTRPAGPGFMTQTHTRRFRLGRRQVTPGSGCERRLAALLAGQSQNAASAQVCSQALESLHQLRSS